MSYGVPSYVSRKMSNTSFTDSFFSGFTDSG